MKHKYKALKFGRNTWVMESSICFFYYEEHSYLKVMAFCEWNNTFTFLLENNTRFVMVNIPGVKKDSDLDSL